jgi:hypothetical protein
MNTKMSSINLSIVIHSHLNDLLIENQIGRTDMVSHRIQFIKELLFDYSDKPLSKTDISDDELNERWEKLYEGVE